MEQSWYLPQTETPFLTLDKPLVFFDLETTGTSVTEDQIVELCAIRLNPNGSQEELHHLVNPGRSIPTQATAVHGITDEMVADKPTFGELAEELATFFRGCDLAGYNIRRFDVPLLMQEFHRHKLYPIHYGKVKIVDTLSIFHSREKRDLAAAVRFYCGREHEGAHSARADVLATIDILKHQLLKYEDLEPNTTFLHNQFMPGNIVDFSGTFARNEEGEIIFNFGKHKGKVAHTEPDYLAWMKKQDFPVDTRMVLTRILKNISWKSEIEEWLDSNKVLQNEATASALYTSVKFGNDVFPFSVSQQEDKNIVVTFLNEPPSSCTLQHEDAVEILLQLLENSIKKEELN